MLSTTKNNTKTSVTRKRVRIAPFRKPVLVYNSRTDSLLSEIRGKTKDLDTFDLSADWMCFMDDLNTRMLEKIYF